METLLKRFQSFKPPTLTGTESSIDCENWLEDIEQLFEALDYTDERWVKLIIHQLHGIGKSWWVATKKAFENQGTVITWAVFRTAFYQRFFPVSYRKDKGGEFANLRQGQLNIEDYVAKFTSLLKFAPHVAMSDEAQADQFINGLNPDVFTLVNTGRPNTFADALNRAKGAEAGLLRHRRAQFVPAAAKAQENPQIPPPPRFDAGRSSSGKKKNFLKEKENSSNDLEPAVLPARAILNKYKLDNKLAIIVPSVEEDMPQNNVEECLASAVFVISRDISQEYVLGVILGISRIQQQQEQCQHQKGKPLLYILINLKIHNKVDKEEARQ
ncbi:hypothetical protein F511_13373 [Dorcoceras hygrometricum]|uniref:Retrotransposon gag domain-containing protein n=1 Tax=Dorcoceras hygrometricum TaxID=472368 RepID=A0A2Z7BBQ2_9LAMI|nr:hypothetical protein F511_13373 [Dorcoceras hygrometricum]